MRVLFEIEAYAAIEVLAVFINSTVTYVEGIIQSRCINVVILLGTTNTSF